MAYETSALRRWDTYATYTIDFTDDELSALMASDDPAATVTDILAAGGAPPPNEVIVHRLSSATDSIQEELDQILSEITSGGGSAPAPATQPHAVVFHQESGEYVSRYITLVYLS